MTSIGIRLPIQEKQALATIAFKHSTTISNIVRRLIRQYIESEE